MDSGLAALHTGQVLQQELGWLVYLHATAFRVPKLVALLALQCGLALELRVTKLSALEAAAFHGAVRLFVRLFSVEAELALPDSLLSLTV